MIAIVISLFIHAVLLFFVLPQVIKPTSVFPKPQAITITLENPKPEIIPEPKPEPPQPKKPEPKHTKVAPLRASLQRKKQKIIRNFKPLQNHQSHHAQRQWINQRI
jgi:hypothetical protein